MTRALVFVHRWLGAALSLLLAVWFVSGIVMMYWRYPEITQRDRLRHAPALRAPAVALTAEQAFADPADQPAFVVLTSFDRRPVYMGGGRMIYADNGAEQLAADRAMGARAAADWVGRPPAEAVQAPVDEVDQWTLSGELRQLLPLRKYSWPDGQQVYVHEESGDVVQHTTRAGRFWAYLGAIPHWLYVPALRTRDSQWMGVMLWSSLLATVTAIVGLVLGVWMFSPRKRYRHAGAPTAVPYHGWKRWHTIIGLVSGLAAVTWGFSGLLTLEPFRWEQQLTDLTVENVSDPQGLRDWTRMADLLRGSRLAFPAYAGKTPAQAIASVPGFEVKELEYASIGGSPVYVLSDGGGATRIVPVHGAPREGFDAHTLAQRMRAAGGGRHRLQVIERYDAYYRDRRRVLPLPVIKIEMADRFHSRYYVDPKTAAVVGSYSDRDWVRRWLYQGLHSWDFPWLYNHRPLWDILVITVMLAGTALCATSLVLTWRLLARKWATLAQGEAAFSAAAAAARLSQR